MSASLSKQRESYANLHWKEFSIAFVARLRKVLQGSVTFCFLFIQ